MMSPDLNEWWLTIKTDRVDTKEIKKTKTLTEEEAGFAARFFVMLGSTRHCLWLCLLIVNLFQPCQAQSNNNSDRYNNNNNNNDYKDNSQATMKQNNSPPIKSLSPHYLVLFGQEDKKDFDDTRTTPDKMGNELKKETSLKFKTEKNNSDRMKKGLLGKYMNEMESSKKGSVLKGKELSNKESSMKEKLPEENAENEETPKKDSSAKKKSYKKLSIKNWSMEKPTKLWSVNIAIKPLKLKSLSRIKRNPKLKQTRLKVKKTKLHSMTKSGRNLKAMAELNNKFSPMNKRLLIQDGGVVSLKNKNPYQPNGAVEQEVMIINRPQSLSSIDHFIKHIRQHMFNHYDSGIMPHGMDHGIGMLMHHNQRRSHAGHVLVDHSVHHWPWHMSIQEENLHGWHHLCHGAMVGHRSVLTNAECVYRKPLPSLRVIRHNLIDKVITLDNSSFITARIIHPKYKDYINHFHKHTFRRHPGRHNLAMLHLGREMGVHPIGLHGMSHAWHGHSPGHCSTYHQNSVHFITNRECDYHLRNEHIGNTHLCTYGLPCGIHHSHGFPLVCYRRGHPYLAGLSSYHSGCGGHHNPTVYERIAPHNDWITNHIL